MAPIALALDQERRASDHIGAPARVAREEGDYASEQFMQWFAYRGQRRPDRPS